MKVSAGLVNDLVTDFNEENNADNGVIASEKGKAGRKELSDLYLL